MGFRFRKSFKIAPGVRVNLGKKSASVSFGKRGLRHTISTTGRSTSSIGIPGTGVYYTKSRKIGKAFDTKLSIENGDNIDPAQEVKDFAKALEYITTFHKECDYNYDWESIYKELPPFEKGEKGPNEIKAQEKLDNYKPSLLGKVLKSLDTKRREELKEQVKKAIKEDKELYKTWEERNKIAKAILEKDTKAYVKLLKDIKFSHELAGFINTFRFYTIDENTMMIEYDLNIEDVIPTHYKTLTKTGRLSVRKFNKTDYYAIVKSYVTSINLRIARNFFGLLPIKRLVINTQRHILDTQLGKHKNITILSIEIDKATLDKLNFDLIDPFDALNNFKHNVRFLKTRGFQEVKKIG